MNTDNICVYFVLRTLNFFVNLGPPFEENASPLMFELKSSTVFPWLQIGRS